MVIAVCSLCCTLHRSVSPQKLLQQIVSLRPDEQLQIFNLLKDALTKSELLAGK